MHSARREQKNSGLQELVHSDLDRAHDTAKAIARTTGAKLISTPDRRPRNLGHLTDKESNTVQDELSPYVVDHPDKHDSVSSRLTRDPSRGLAGFMRGANAYAAKRNEFLT